MSVKSQTFTATAGEVAAALARRGIGPDEPAMIIIKRAPGAAGTHQDERAQVIVFVQGGTK